MIFRDTAGIHPDEHAFFEKDPDGIQPGEPGAKLDDGKLQVWLCISGFPRALAEVARVSTYGAKKYSRNGWKSVKDGEERYMEAFGRHELELAMGHEIDPTTGLLHRAQMIWNLCAALELYLQGQESLKQGERAFFSEPPT